MFSKKKECVFPGILGKRISSSRVFLTAKETSVFHDRGPRPGGAGLAVGPARWFVCDIISRRPTDAEPTFRADIPTG